MSDRFTELKYLALILLWVGAWHTSILLAYLPYASLWYLPAGISMAAFVVLGKRALLPIALAATLVDYPFHDLPHFIGGLLLGLVHTSSYAIAGFIYRRSLLRLATGDFPRKTLILLSCFMLGALLAGFLGLSVNLILERTAEQGGYQDLLTWWIGDLIGCLVLTPIMVTLLQRWWPRQSPPMQSFVASQMVDSKVSATYYGKLLLVAGMIIAVQAIDSITNIQQVPYLLFFLGLPLLWISYTEHPFYSAVALLVVSLIIVFGIRLFTLHEHAATYQFALCITAIHVYLSMAVPRLLQQNQRLSEFTMTDALTGVASQHFFAAVLEHAQQHRQTGKQHYLLKLSISNLATINDTYGRAIGDQVLIDTAHQLRELLNPGDLLARADSEAFLLLLTNRDSDTAEQLMLLAKRMLPEVAYRGFIVPIEANVQLQTVDCEMHSQQQLQQLLSEPTSTA